MKRSYIYEMLAYSPATSSSMKLEMTDLRVLSETCQFFGKVGYKIPFDRKVGHKNNLQRTENQLETAQPRVVVLSLGSGVSNFILG